MELLRKGITEKREEICGNREESEDIEEWEGLSMNEQKEVVEINWLSIGLTGSINLSAFPQKFRIVSFITAI
jgi:hypothetical protein